MITLRNHLEFGTAFARGTDFTWAGRQCPNLAITYRQSHRRGTSAMAPGSDIPAAMSDFELISSALPPGSDVADSPGIRGVMTQSGSQGFHPYRIRVW